MESMLGEGCEWENGQGSSLPGLAGSSPCPRELCLLRTMSSLFFLPFSVLSSTPAAHQYQFPAPLSYLVTSLPCQHLFSHTGIGTLVQNRCLLSLPKECRATASPYNAFAHISKRYPFWADTASQQGPLGSTPLFSDQPIQLSTGSPE